MDLLCRSLIFLEAILQTRLYALYSLNKKILTLMLACFSLSIASSGYIMGSVLSKLTGKTDLFIFFASPNINNHLPLSVADNFARWFWDVLPRGEHRVGFLHVLDTAPRV